LSTKHLLLSESAVDCIEISDNEEEREQVAWTGFLSHGWRIRVLGVEAKLTDADVENYITLELNNHPTHCLLPSNFLVQTIRPVFAFLSKRKMAKYSLITILASLNSTEKEWLMENWRRIERKAQDRKARGGLIMVPYIEHDHHFRLFVISREKKTVEYFDSLFDFKYPETMERAQEPLVWFARVFLTADLIPLRVITQPQQSNDIDCGVWVCLYAKMCLEGRTVAEVEGIDIATMRLIIAVCFHKFEQEEIATRKTDKEIEKEKKEQERKRKRKKESEQEEREMQQKVWDAEWRASPRPRQKHKTLCGLPNIYNSCWLIAGLQCLAHAPHLHQWLQNRLPCNPSPSSLQLFAPLERCLQDIGRGQRTESLSALRKHLINAHQSLGGLGIQQDVDEFIVFVMMNLRDNGLAQNLFMTSSLFKSCCANCGMVMQEEQTNHMWFLPLQRNRLCPPPENSSLEELIKQHLEPRKEEDMYVCVCSPRYLLATNIIISFISSGCSYCARLDTCTRTEYISALPQLLMFELKRFDNDLNKVCTYVSAPEVITMNNKAFKLYATCVRFLAIFFFFQFYFLIYSFCCSITAGILSREGITMLLSRKTSGT
jgi:hypothetical protein